MMPTIIPQLYPAVSLTAVPCVLLFHLLLFSCLHLFYRPDAWDYRTAELEGQGFFLLYLACPQISLWLQTLHYGFKKPQTA